jgi:F1F0 ATPase subunit 2
MQTSIPALAWAFFMGAAIGIFYFGGLWWTVQRLPRTSSPGLWVLGSFGVRSCAGVAGFYFIMGDDWVKLMAGLAGFFLVRVLSVRGTVMPLRRP